MISVLYVDDEPGMREVAQVFLEEAGDFRVATAVSAKKALDSPDLLSYDAIISDYMMPGMDGIGFLKAVRERSTDIPFILFTGRGREEVVIEAINNGADSYIQKGGDPDTQFAELAHRIRQAVRRRRAELDRIRSEERFSRLFHANPSLEAITDFTTGTLIDVNEAWIHVTGYSRDDAVGKSTRDLGLFVDYTERERMAQAITREGVLRNFETRIRTKSGDIRTLDFTGQRIRAGERDFLFTQAVDITERKQREEELAFNNAVLTTQQETSLDAILIVDGNGKILHYNRQFTRLWGVPEDLVAQRVDEPVLRSVTKQLADPEAFHARVKYLYEHKEEKSFEELLLKDGRVLERFSAPMLGETGKYYGRVWYFRDITRRKQTEAALSESEQRFRNLIQNASDMIRIIGRDGLIRYSSPSTKRIIGYDPADLVGTNPLDYVHPDDRDRVKAALEEVFSRTSPGIPTEFRVRHRDGGYIDVETIASNLTDTPGINGIVTTTRPITERKRAEEALRRSEEKYRLLTENTIDIIYSMDLEGRITHISPHVARYGYTPDQLISHNISEVIAEADLPRVLEDIQTTVATGKSTRTTFRLKDFPEIWLEDNGTVIKKADGVATGISGVLRDITERTTAESAMQAMVRSMVGTTGLDALKKITENISSWLAADCVMVGQIQPDYQTVKVVSMLLDGKEVGDYSYTLRGTPCEDVAEKGYCLYPDNAARLFPESKDLAELNIRGYIGTPLRDSRGNAIGILCALFRTAIHASPRIQEIIDIIAVKAAAEIERIGIERELEENRNLLERAMDLTGMAGWGYDPVTGLFLFDDRFYTLYGTSAEREGGYRMTPERYNREFVHPDDRDAVAAVIKAAPASAAPDQEFQMEHRIIRRDGEIRHILVRCGIIADTGGQMIRIHGANQDITERKRAEEALRQAHKKLHLLSSITRHDIGNQLMTLNGFVAVLHKKVADPLLENHFSRITEASRQITAMIAFTKEYEKIGVQAPVWHSLAGVVNEAGKGILPGQVLMKNDLPPGTEVFADPLIVKVFFNLLDNSIRHGQRVTEIRVSSRRSGGDLVVVWEDNGVGIADEEKVQIFEPGFGKNTGLGLFLVREILSLTGIRITETGLPGVCARFEIAVPKGAYRNAPEK